MEWRNTDLLPPSCRVSGRRPICRSAGYGRSEARDPRDLPLDEAERRASFEAVLLPHLSTAYNLARWLTHHDHDAEDLVQEAYLRAFRFFDGFQGDGARAWFLAIVRNTCLTWLKRNRTASLMTPFDELTHSPAGDGPGPDGRLVQSANREIVHQALRELPAEFREVVVLREIEGMSYKDIATVTDAAIGTVMSRLARSRGLLRQLLAGHAPDGS